MLKLEGLFQRIGEPSALLHRVQDASRFIRLASASYDDTVRIWDPATGQCVSTLEGHSYGVNSVAWSQDGSRLASASNDNTVRIWDPATGEYASTLQGHSNSVSEIAWLQDGSRLASASGNTVSIWDPATGECASTLKGHSYGVNSIAWSQDGSRLASASGNTVSIWDPTAGECASTLQGHSAPVNSTAWLQGGGRLASASDGNTVRIWNPATGQCESTLHISSPNFQIDKVNSNHLHTSIVTFDVGFTGSVTSTPHCSTLPEQYGYGLNDDRSWITYNGVNLIWLPTEYRPPNRSLFAMSATNLAIACSSRLVIFLALTKQSPIPGL